ncbi:MAG TPA: beta-N-acetylhexosaminidase, partial [Rikenellaceae bacterium]|nr:beta-N-acetylhexosaminidase [Rikenellaceae bacterium]
HLAAGAKITYDGQKYSSGYPAGGDAALVDGKLGGWFYKDNRWQGFLCDVDVTIDLGAVKDVHYVGATFLSHTSAEVGFPVKTEASFSEDGLTYSDPVVCILQIPDNDSCALLNTIGTVVNARTRYIKYKAIRDDVTKNRNHAFIFIDEIVVN